MGTFVVALVAATLPPVVKERRCLRLVGAGNAEQVFKNNFYNEPTSTDVPSPGT
jgi:hypothetical protein